MAEALGYHFLDEKGHTFLPTAQSLHKIASIEMPEENILEGINFSVLTDVNNPLTGKNGATFQYAVQKGASEIDLPILDKGMKHLQSLIEKQFNFNIDKYPGAGASGGMGGGSTFFLNAELHSGIGYIADALNLDEKVKNADYVISGEGKLDEQSFKGKVVSGVAEACRRNGKPIYLIVGINILDEKLPSLIKSVWSLTTIAGNQESAINSPKIWLEKAADELYKKLKTQE
jgi:glycerate kinase